MRCAWLAVTRFRDGFNFSFNVGFYFKPIIQLGLVAFVACATNILDHIASEIIKALVNYEVPDLNRPPFVMGWMVLAHERTLGRRGC